jgi:hypothetical protein
MTTAEALTLMLLFGTFVVSLLGLIMKLIKEYKK